MWPQRAPTQDAPPVSRPEPSTPSQPDAQPPPAPSELEARFGPREDLPPEVQRYLDSTVYPPGVGRLTEDQTDLLEPNRRFETFRPIPETMSSDPEAVVHVRLTTDRYFYEGDASVELELAARRGQDPIDLARIEASVVRESRDGDDGRRLPLRFEPTGTGYVARFKTARFADHHGPLRVDARIEYTRGQFHLETLRLFLTPEGKIPARFTGDLADRVSGGNLRVEVGVRVDQPGTYRIDANLYDRNGAPVAFSAFKGRLDRGDRFAPIDFFGRLLHDVGASGPYSVGEIRGYRFLDGGHPDRERIPDLKGHHRLDTSDLSLLSTAEHMSEQRLRMVGLLLEDVARGLSLDVPAPPQQTSTPTAPKTPSAPAPGAQTP